ncbi:hypothetical protein BESB_079100 [Besnoitia besnoiti]|uniref:CNH domain-containing protein n=1 Tax=Besnoitia besnoiti TaxID=94643 RepID=A0A2A9M923_BESBE|nr:hypothetical protein BESB_079100 [Besnoitia besnoiti]PFH33694.1 hypothetical protein BESB_079100 [Besnoitia besnoiti]
MMKAFHCIPVTDLANETVSAVAYTTEHFLIGTEAGSLLKFSLPDTDDPGELAAGAKLLGQFRLSRGKRVEKLAILESLQLVICFEDGNVHLLPLALNGAGYVLCRNASTCCVHQSGEGGALAEKGAAGRERDELRFLPELCVGLKKKIVLYSIVGTDFQPYKEVALLDTPLTLCWRDAWICIGTKKEYLSLRHDQEKATEILALDAQASRALPQMLMLPDEEVLILGLENLGIFFNLVTQMPSQRNTIRWAADLVHVSVCFPYLVGITASGLVEAYSIHGQNLCQTLHLPPPLTALASNGRHLLVTSKTSVSCLFPVPFKQQLHKLLLASRTADALHLLSANFSADDPRRATELSAFHDLAGWVEFSRLQFPAAFQHFSYAGADVLRIISFWSAHLPSWWRTPAVYLETSSSSPHAASQLDCSLVPRVEEISRFIRERTDQTRAGDGEQQGEAKHQVLLELANSSMAAFLSKERASLLMGRSDRVHWAPLQEAAESAPYPAESREDLLAFLLSLVDTLLFMLMVESDDERWKTLLLDAQPPLACNVEDCRAFLLAVHRPDALAAMLSRFGRREEALEIWAQIVKGELRIAPKATAVSDGIQELLALLAPVEAFEEGESEAPLSGGGGEAADAAKEKRKRQEVEEELLQRYAPLVLRADPMLARQLFFSPQPSMESRLRVSPSLVMRLLQEGIDDRALSQKLQEAFIEEIVLNVAGDEEEADASARALGGQEERRERAEWRREAAELQTHLAMTYIDRLLDSSAGSADADTARRGEGELSRALADVRMKLLELLERRRNYHVESLLKKVEGSWLWKETALLYGRLGRHQDALHIIAVRLRDEETAEAYCLMIDDALQAFVDGLSPDEYASLFSSDALFEVPAPFLSLARLSSSAGRAGGEHGGFASIFSPHSPWKQQLDDLPQDLHSGGLGRFLASGATSDGGARAPCQPRASESGAAACVKERKPAGPRRSAGLLRALLKVLLRAWREASVGDEAHPSGGEALAWKGSILNLLTKYGAHPDLAPSLVVRLLPDAWLLTEVSDYLVSSFRNLLHEKMTASLQEQLSTVSYLQTYSRWASQRAASYVVTPERSCPVCTRRLGSAAFVAYPDGTCVHLQCAGDVASLPLHHESPHPQNSDSRKREGTRGAYQILKLCASRAFAAESDSRGNNFLLRDYAG